MKRMLQKTGLFLAMCFMLSAAALCVPLQAYAGTTAKNGAKCYDLAVNKKYKKYDITGDKKKDTIKIKTVSGASGSAYIQKLTVYVNGKKCLKKTYQTDVKPEIKLIRLKNKRPYLSISALKQDGSYHSGNIYTYKSGKLAGVLNLTKLVSKVASYWDQEAWGGNGKEYVGLLSATIQEVSGNGIYIRIGHTGGRFAAGEEIYRYQDKGGKLAMYKTFPLQYTEIEINLANNQQMGSSGEQIWPFAGGYGTANQGNVIPVKADSADETVVTAAIDSHMGAGYSLRVKAYKKGTTAITVTAADGRTAKLKVTVV